MKKNLLIIYIFASYICLYASDTSENNYVGMPRDLIIKIGNTPSEDGKTYSATCCVPSDVYYLRENRDNIKTNWGEDYNCDGGAADLNARLNEPDEAIAVIRLKGLFRKKWQSSSETWYEYCCCCTWPYWLYASCKVAKQVKNEREERRRLITNQPTK